MGPFVAHEEHRHGALSGMAADDGADVAQANLPLQLREAVLHGVHDQPGVLRALAVADKALAVIVPAALGVLLLGLAINLLGLRQERLRVPNMLPGVFLPVAYIPLYNWIGGLIG